ncbi:PUA-like domain-containing protein [Peziza echinospora]|nr:PUA-like domain-containing protein [Peziza echinospora]
MSRIIPEREDSVMTDVEPEESEEYKPRIKPEPTDDDHFDWEFVKNEFPPEEEIPQVAVKTDVKREAKLEDDDEILEEEKIDPTIHLGTDGLRAMQKKSATPPQAPAGSAANPVDVEAHKHLSGVNLLVAQSQGPRRALFFLRFRTQKYTRLAKEGNLTDNDIAQCIQVIDHCAWHPFESVDPVSKRRLSGGMGPHSDYRVTKIAAAIKCFTDPLLFPMEVVDKATKLLNHWKSGTVDPLWGMRNNAINNEEGTATENVETGSGDEAEETDDDAPRAHSTGTGRRGGSGNSYPHTPIDPATRDHRISPEELMRGIVITRPKPGQPGSRSYKLDPRYPQRPADKFGHNGHQVGAWWPYQICALRDGAHGSRMGGIHGRIDMGCFSVVISGGSYDGNDNDMGDRVFYSGSKGENDEDINRDIAPLTNATKSLITSSRSRQPVRVLRSYKGMSRFAPSQGIRYDGLYNVFRYSIETGSDRKKFYQFELRRCPNQPPIDRGRPSKEELRALDAFQRTL